MAHNINTYIGRQAAWHKLGTVTGKYQTTDELLSDPGFQFTVFKSQLRDGLGRPVDAWGTFRWDLKDKLAGNKDAAIFLNAVGEDYAVMQHDEGFKSVDTLIQSSDPSSGRELDATEPLKSVIKNCEAAIRHATRLLEANR